MPTKTPKTKKPAAKEVAANSKESPAKAKPAKAAKGAKAAEPVRPPPSGEEEDRDEEEDDDDEDVPAKPAPKPAAKKPAEDAQPIVPARRLTPEAKARVNEMVKKGMSLTDALRAAASWETFVAPIKTPEEQQPPGKPGGPRFDGAPRPRPPVDDDETEESISIESDD